MTRFAALALAVAGPPVRARRPRESGEVGLLGADLRLVDVLCAAYLSVVAVLVALFRARVDSWPVLVVGHLGLIALSLLFPGFAARHPRRATLSLLRVYYPALCVVWAYLEMDLIQPMFSGGWTASAWVADLDVALFRVHPTAWVERFYGSALDEVMAFFYLAYYLVPLIVTIPLIRRGRRDDVLALAGAVTLTYFVNFALFLAIPALGPRSAPELAALHHDHYSGPFFARLAFALLGTEGPVQGAAFPSSHVSATMTWALAALRIDRRLGLRALPFALGIMPATVYLGYHHAVDPLAGALLALACARIGLAIARRRRRPSRTQLDGDP